MKDTRHRNYDYVPPVTKKEQTVSDLLAEIMFFIQNTELKREDWFLLNRMIRNLEKGKHANKVLRGIENKFAKIKEQYQR